MKIARLPPSSPDPPPALMTDMQQRGIMPPHKFRILLERTPALSATIGSNWSQLEPMQKVEWSEAISAYYEEVEAAQLPPEQLSVQQIMQLRESSTAVAVAALINPKNPSGHLKLIQSVSLLAMLTIQLLVMLTFSAQLAMLTGAGARTRALRSTNYHRRLYRERQTSCGRCAARAWRRPPRYDGGPGLRRHVSSEAIRASRCQLQQLVPSRHLYCCRRWLCWGLWWGVSGRVVVPCAYIHRTFSQLFGRSTPRPSRSCAAAARRVRPSL